MNRAQRELCVLSLILLIAAFLRFYGLAWDGGYLFHPDERKILLVVSDLHVPASIPEFFSAESPLNPKFFAYGSFPIYLLKALGAFAPTIPFNVPWREDFVSLAMFGRALSALFDLGTIVFIFLLARRLYDAMVGLIASACVAVTVLNIQLSHFYTVDTLLTLLIVATMFFAVRYTQTGKPRDAILIGATCGLALATKITAVPLIMPIVVAVITADHRTPTAVNAVGRLRSVVQLVRAWLRQIWDVRQTLARIIGITFVVFIVTQPYALLDPIRYFGQVGTELLVARGWLDYPYTRQYADTLPFIYSIAQSSVWGMSLPLGIFAWGASGLFTWNWWHKRDRRDGFILSWALIYFLVTGGQYAKYLRYLLPLLPFLFLMSGVYVSRLTRHVSRSILHFAFCVSLLCAVVYSFAFVSMYSREHPWITLSRWIYANVPPQSMLAIEHWDDALPVPMRSDQGDRSPTEFQTRTLPMYDTDDAAKLATLVDVLGSSDYIVMATQRLSATITRLPQRYPMSSRYYRLLFNGLLGFEPVAFAANGIALDGIVVADNRFEGLAPPLFIPSDAFVWNWGHADESFTVYDHPLPLVFKKTTVLSRGELRNLFLVP